MTTPVGDSLARTQLMLAPQTSTAGDDPETAPFQPGTLSNDGRAQQLDTTRYEGNRAMTLDQIDARISIIDHQRAQIQQQIDAAKKSIADKQSTANRVDFATKLGLPPLAAVDAIAHLFNKRFNPGADATAAIQHTKDDINRLTTQNDQLGSEETQLNGTKHARLDQRALNFLTNVSHLTTMGDDTTRTLDGTGNVKLQIIDGKDGDANASADASYDPDTNTIKVPRATIDKVNGDIDKLQQQGIVDDRGTIVKPDQFDKSSIGDDAIAWATTIGVHERTHGKQQQDGTYQAVEDSGANVGAGDPKLEYQAYRDQELTELHAGRHKGAFLTIDEHGNLLPRWMADANIKALEAGQPLPYDGAKQDAPGRHAPGRHAPGRHAPGRHAPGRHAPGHRTE